MFTFEDIGQMLDEICEEIPQPFFEKLNGGVNLLPDVKMHALAVSDDLYIMGDYNRDSLGKYINIYYGSIMKNYPDCSPEQMRRHLKKLLQHEFTHHIESLAGERSLEIKDEEQLDAYMRKKENGKSSRRRLARRRPETDPWERSEKDPW